MKKEKLLTLLPLMLTPFMMTGCNNDSTDIGILQFGEFAALDDAREGFIQGLKDAGFGDATGLPYFNSGVIFARDTEIVHQFYADWYDNWCKSRQGMHNGRAKFTPEEVIDIRRKYDSGWSIADIIRYLYPNKIHAKDYKSIHSNITRIAKRETWKHLIE